MWFPPLCGPPLCVVPPFMWFPPLCGSPLYVVPPFVWFPHYVVPSLCGSPLYVVPPFMWFPPLCGSHLYVVPPLCSSLIMWFPPLCCSPFIKASFCLHSEWALQKSSTQITAKKSSHCIHTGHLYFLRWITKTMLHYIYYSSYVMENFP